MPLLSHPKPYLLRQVPQDLVQAARGVAGPRVASLETVWVQRADHDAVLLEAAGETRVQPLKSAKRTQ